MRSRWSVRCVRWSGFGSWRRHVGRAVVPVYQYRYGNGLARLRRLIAAGVTGEPLVASIEIHWNRLPA